MRGGHGLSKEHTRVEALLRALMQQLGYDHSESATEAFVVQLKAAATSLQPVIAASHDDGLCYDCVPKLAERLLKNGGRVSLTPLSRPSARPTHAAARTPTSHGPVRPSPTRRSARAPR